MAQSIEPNIADLANSWLKSYKLDYKLEQESLNSEIDKALIDYFTKKQEILPKPQLTVYTFPARPPDVVSLLYNNSLTLNLLIVCQ